MHQDKYSMMSVARPSSAQANMQSHPCYQASLFNDSQRAVGNIEAWKERLERERPRTNAQHHQSQQQQQQQQQNQQINSNIKKDYQLEHVIWSQSVKQPRRLTLQNVEDIDDLEIEALKRQKSYALARISENRSKRPLEEKMTLDSLQELHTAFREASHNGANKVGLEEFKQIIRKALKLQGKSDDEITALFIKIDFSSDGQISWREFCTFMQLNFSEKEDAIKRQKEVVFNPPNSIESNPHRHPVNKIISTPDNQFLVLATDGQVSAWGSNGKLKNIRRDIIDKRKAAKGKGDKQDTKRAKLKWITDFVLMTEFSKLLVGTGDCELQFWEYSSFGFEPYCQVSSLETTPIKLSYCCNGRDDVTIAYGDTDGCVNILKFSSMGETLRLWKSLPKTAEMPTINLINALESSSVKSIRWKVHNDWVEQIRIEQRLNQIISCSNDESNALVIGCILPSTELDTTLTQNSPPSHSNAGSSLSQADINSFQQHAEQQQRQKTSVTTHQQQRANTLVNIISAKSSSVKRRPSINETIFQVYKGVKCFDFSMEKNILITGGMDTIVRLFNPYVPTQPIARLQRHKTPIFYIYLSSEDNRIFTLSIDRYLNIWDLVDHSCLVSIGSKFHKITGDLQSCAYNLNTKSFLICTDKIVLLSLKLKNDLYTEVVLSHKEAVTCCLYNKQFKQLVSCTESGLVKLWDLETGKSVFEFSNAHDELAITCMTFDETYRRLITGGRDGTCKVWNFNNGHCLKILQKDNLLEINDCKYLRIYNNKFIISVGWDRRINIYDDDSEDVRFYVNPNVQWDDDREQGHKEDIVCIGKSESNLLATASYDGEIIVWNLVSGHIFCKIQSPKPSEHRESSLDGDLSVNKLIFLNRNNYMNKNCAHLIASGPYGMIHFWSVFSGLELYARFKIPFYKTKNDKVGNFVVQMTIDAKYSKLFLADNNGYIYHWNIKDYAIGQKETKCPELVKCWRAHTQTLNTLEYIESSRVLISCSNDFTIRVWTLQGEYVGTFGQEETWNLYDQKTYKHPLVPYDVLIDAESIPDHPLLNQIDSEVNLQQASRSDLVEASSSSFMQSSKKFQPSSRKIETIDDEQIEQIAKDISVQPEQYGKRLRHEKFKPVASSGNKSYYQMLKCYECREAPQVQLIRVKPIKEPTYI